MVAILKYNAGNVQSVIYALQRLGVEYVLTDEPEVLLSADKVIFPGVGAAGTTMTYLRERKLDEVIRNIKNPLLGICLGMQLLCKHSEENDTDCIGIFDTAVKKFNANTPLSLLRGVGGEVNKYKVPHIGWNNLINCKGKLFNNTASEPDVYFVHSYYVEQNSFSIADCNYILPFSAAIKKDNFYAVQFHTEKSSKAGEQILKNFLEL
jgi:imidazole glycerol-phosphate synthase subunit HisH